MKVHIVLQNAGLIVPRMAGWLAERNGWSMSDAPRSDVDCNLYMPYLAFMENYAARPMTAAWFTHYEEGNPLKERAWQVAAKQIDLPLVTAEQYQEGYGLEEKFPYVIIPGIDRDYFRYVDFLPRKARTVGVCGIGAPRKGPQLLVDLFYSGLECHLEIVGGNWPFPHKALEHGELLYWYNRIDVLLCTSTIECIPGPVLEALACGTKVVIPRGVGICDELPEMAGIRHYDAGDSASMLTALDQAFGDTHEPEALRAVTEAYSVEAWCDSVQLAIEEFVHAGVRVPL